jgi:SNW domain-containing protein 1
VRRGPDDPPASPRPATPHISAQALAKPDEEEIEETARETAAALALRVDKKQAAVNPKTVPQQPGAAQYIKYTPADGGPQHGSGAGSRIIKMQDMPVDPLEPPKFRHIKASPAAVPCLVLL